MAQSLDHRAHELALDDGRIDRTPDVAQDEVRLGVDLARRHVDAHDGEMHGERADAAGRLVAPLRLERGPGPRCHLAQRPAPIGQAADDRRAVLQAHVIRARLEVPGGEGDDLLAQVPGSLVHGTAGHDRGAAGGAADAVRHPSRVAQMHDDVRQGCLPVAE